MKSVFLHDASFPGIPGLPLILALLSGKCRWPVLLVLLSRQTSGPSPIPTGTKILAFYMNDFWLPNGGHQCISISTRRRQARAVAPDFQYPPPYCRQPCTPVYTLCCLDPVPRSRHFIYHRHGPCHDTIQESEYWPTTLREPAAGKSVSLRCTFNP